MPNWGNPLHLNVTAELSTMVDAWLGGQSLMISKTTAYQYIIKLGKMHFYS